MPAAGVPHQIDRPGTKFLDEADHIVDVLRDRIGVTDAVPVLGKKVPQRHRDQAMLLRERAKHGGPNAKVAERAVHAHQRRALPDIEIGHVVSVDAKRLHARLVRGGGEGGSMDQQYSHGNRRMPIA